MLKRKPRKSLDERIAEQDAKRAANKAAAAKRRGVAQHKIADPRKHFRTKVANGVSLFWLTLIKAAVLVVLPSAKLIALIAAFLRPRS